MSHTLEKEKPVEKPAWSEVNPSGERTIMLFGGITEGVDTLAGLSQVLGDEGFRTISFDYATGPADPREGEDYFARHHERKVQQAEEILLATIQAGKKVTLLGHSMAGPIATEVALRHPDRVDRVVLSNVTGLFEDNFPRLAGRFGTEMVRKSLTFTPLGRKQQLHGAKEIFDHPTSLAGDAVDTANADIREKVRKLRELGIRVDVLASAKDQGYPWRLVKDGLNPDQEIAPFEIAVDSISSYFTQKTSRSGKTKQHYLASRFAGHDQPIIYPVQTAQLVKQLLTSEIVDKQVNTPGSR